MKKSTSKVFKLAKFAEKSVRSYGVKWLRESPGGMASELTFEFA